MRASLMLHTHSPEQSTAGRHISVSVLLVVSHSLNEGNDGGHMIGYQLYCSYVGGGVKHQGGSLLVCAYS